MVARIIQLNIYLVSLLMLCSCFGKINRVSSRAPGGLEKVETGPMMVNARPIQNTPKEAPQIFVKKKSVKIEPVNKRNNHGSLYNLDDGRNELYTENKPQNVGDYLRITVNTNLKPQKTEQAEEPANNNAAQAEESENKSLEDELLASLPHLEPKERKNGVPKSFQMRILHKAKNGDIFVEHKRTSQRQADHNSVTIKARIPYFLLRENDQLNTDHLADIYWLENTQGEIFERFSANWQDEYTLRLAGFTEANSIYAQSVEDKRRELQDIRSRIENELKNMNDERRQMASEREKLLTKKEVDDKKIKQLEETVKEQQEKIDSLVPTEDKPGENRDGK